MNDIPDKSPIPALLRMLSVVNGVLSLAAIPLLAGVLGGWLRLAVAAQGLVVALVFWALADIHEATVR